MTAINQPQAWLGILRLRYGRQHQQTVPLESYAQAPWRLQRPLYADASGHCQSVLIHTAGGMVGGDALQTTVDLQPGSCALITTAAASKVYRSQGATATQTHHLTLASDTCLEWFPQETILFRGAHYAQSTRVDLAPGAIWVAWDLTRFGRSARGEVFDAGSWRSCTEVWQEGRPLWLDRQVLTGDPDRFQSPHGLAGCSVVGSFVVLGVPGTRDWVAMARNHWQDFTAVTEADAGVTQLQAGLLCRYRGHSSQQARRWFSHLWQALRPHYLEQPACLPRVWSL
ncbi:Urease accessory protein UreD [Halomicronema hongdechloris C2206]|uniref:Urease accessory protein UreD n=1 Tax=Halomicronema hongdechloris C2206 TaxID=1641165 RepID=A0A1Z3HIN8_9CYAN|nr:urease accessory protein UreD [Halomicronema hongdechloris]ASC70143.1 Urease accessory protein UreD [Halomicronema hongdechloris C2206]